MRAGCVWEQRRRRHFLCPLLPLLCRVHIPLGPNLSPLSSRTPQPQVTQAWRPALSQPVIIHKSFHALKENFCAVLTGSRTPASLRAPCRAGLGTPWQMLCPDPAALCSQGAPAALPTPPLQCPGKAPSSSAVRAAIVSSPWHTQEGASTGVPDTLGLLQAAPASCRAQAACPPTPPPGSHPQSAGMSWGGGGNTARLRPATSQQTSSLPKTKMKLQVPP